MQNDDIYRELERIAKRLARIEAAIGLPVERPFFGPSTPASTPPVATTPQVEPSMPMAPQRPAALVRPTESTDERVRDFKNLKEDWRKQNKRDVAVGEQSATNKSPADNVGNSTRAPTVSGRYKEPASSQSLELLIGGKWMAWLGALTVLLAVAFAIMVGVKHGWWGRLSPEIRCLGIAVFGVAMLTGGEISLRRLGQAASVGLFSAGLGTLYMDAFATFRYFNIFSSQSAFLLMAIVAAAGFAITLRTRFLTIGVLSIIGGYVTPILLHGESSHDVELLLFLTMLLGVSLGLSATWPRDFRPLRFLAIGGQALIGGLWIAGNASSPAGAWLMGIFFVSLWWALVMGESLFAALRRQTPMGNVMAVILATTAFVIAGCWILKFGPSAPGMPAGKLLSGLVVANWLGVFTLMVAVIGVVIALHFGPAVSEISFSPRTAIDRFTLAVWAQSGVLLIVAVALQFRGLAQSVGWLTMALVAIELGRRLQARGVTLFGLICGSLAIIRIAAFDWWATPGMNTPIWSVGDVTITKWSLLALGAIAVQFVAAHRIWTPTRSTRDGLAVAIASLATTGWLIVCVVQSTGMMTTGGWLFGAAALLAFERLGRRQAYAEISVFVLTIAAARWLTVDALGHRLEQAWSAHEMWPLLNWQVGIAIAIVGLVWWAQIVFARNMADARSVRTFLLPLQRFLPIALGIFALIALSFEVDRALARDVHPSRWFAVWTPAQLRGLLLTALWCAGGLAMLRIGLSRRAMSMAGVGFMIIAAAAVVWAVFDSLVWRISNGAVQTTTVLNLQFIVGALVILMLAIAAMWIHRSGVHAIPSLRTNAQNAVAIGCTLIALLGLLLGSLEIDRYFVHYAMQRQAGFSVYGALYGVGLVVVGFLRQIAAVRYAGLALLALVAVKVVLIDFAYLDDLPRVVSTLAAGLLFIGTSMLYFKLSPRLNASIASARPVSIESKQESEGI